MLKCHFRINVYWFYLSMLGHLLILVAARLVMLVKVGLEGEGLVTLAALVVLEGCVCLHVGPQVGSVRKALAAVRAAEWLVSGVGPLLEILYCNTQLWTFNMIRYLKCPFKSQGREKAFPHV